MKKQRAILTTWKMNVDNLSPEALQVLRVLSMLGNSPVPSELAKFVLQENADEDEDDGSLLLRYHKILLSEIVFNSSLLQRHKSSEEDEFQMHRLVRLFIHIEMEQGSDTWRAVLRRATIATHGCVRNILQLHNKTFNDEAFQALRPPAFVSASLDFYRRTF